MFIADGGVRRGSDIVKYLSLGADMVGIGRPALYGLVANGQDGVENIFNILLEELRISMINGGFKNINAVAVPSAPANARIGTKTTENARELYRETGHRPGSIA